MRRPWLLIALALTACASPWDSLRERSKQCTGTRRDCDNNMANGCETDIATDRQHCGQCGNVALVACSEGRSLDVFAIAGAAGTQCAALRGDGTSALRCWGANTQHQVSATSNGSSAIPVDPTPTLHDEIKALVLGDGFGCAVRGDVAAVDCWGDAVRLPSLSASDQLLAVSSITAGARHVCALVRRAGTSESVVRCFGDNDRGQLGAAAVMGTPVTTVTGLDRQPLVLSNALRVAAGATHTCVSTMSGVYCWGAFELGQLGRAPIPGIAATAAAPVQFGRAAVNAIDLAAAGDSTCAVVSDAPSLEDAGTDAALPSDAATMDVTAVDASTDASSSADASASADASCARPSSGSDTLRARVLCWGAITNEVSCGATVSTVTTEGGAPLESARRVFVGSTHACAITESGEVFCWGRGGEGRFADGTSPGAMRAVRVAALRGATELSIVGAGNIASPAARTPSRESFCALITSGARSVTRCWGPNDFAQLGDAQRGVETISAPADVRW